VDSILTASTTVVGGRGLTPPLQVRTSQQRRTVCVHRRHSSVKTPTGERT
jgi:hypothetical protein